MQNESDKLWLQILKYYVNIIFITVFAFISTFLCVGHVTNDLETDQRKSSEHEDFKSDASSIGLDLNPALSPAFETHVRASSGVETPEKKSDRGGMSQRSKRKKKEKGNPLLKKAKEGHQRASPNEEALSPSPGLSPAQNQKKPSDPILVTPEKIEESASQPGKNSNQLEECTAPGDEKLKKGPKVRRERTDTDILQGVKEMIETDKKRKESSKLKKLQSDKANQKAKNKWRSFLKKSNQKSSNQPTEIEPKTALPHKKT